MKLYAPSYYPQFSCIADKCRHSCCVQWEIDIDKRALKRYKSMKGEIGRRLQAAIVHKNGIATFRLTAGKRCPMLNENGLCDLITACGEEALCQICADHPRFRSFFFTRKEIGLGLCCEEAARLVLSQQEPVELIVLEDDGKPDEEDEEEAMLLKERQRLTNIAQRRTMPFAQRLRRMEAVCGIQALRYTPQEVGALLLSLENLDPVWKEHAKTLSKQTSWPVLADEWSIPLEQLLVYLLYRNIPGALGDDMIPEYATLCTLLCRVIAAIFACQPEQTFDTLVEIVRMASLEIEYSDENIDDILTFLELHNQ